MFFIHSGIFRSFLKMLSVHNGSQKHRILSMSTLHAFKWLNIIKQSDICHNSSEYKNAGLFVFISHIARFNSEENSVKNKWTNFSVFVVLEPDRDAITE